MKFIIIYVIIAVVYETIAIITGYRKLKKNPQLAEFFTLFYQQLASTPSWQATKNKLPLYYILAGICFIIIAPLLFPFSLFTTLRKLVYKTKSEKEAEAKEKESEAFFKSHKKFMENEGVMQSGETEETVGTDETKNGDL